MNAELQTYLSESEGQLFSPQAGGEQVRLVSHAAEAVTLQYLKSGESFTVALPEFESGYEEWPA